MLGGAQSNFYAKSLAYTKDDLIPDASIDKLFKYIDETDKGTLAWFLIWDLEGGAINDVAPDATAYGHRDALFYHQAYAVNLFGHVDDKIRNFLTGLNKVVTDGLGHDLGAYAGYVDRALGDDGPNRPSATWLPSIVRGVMRLVPYWVIPPQLAPVSRALWHQVRSIGPVLPCGEAEPRPSCK